MRLHLVSVFLCEFPFVKFLRVTVNVRYSLHDASSDPSVQSLFPSHIHANGMHSPLLLRQEKSSDEQTFLSVNLEIHNGFILLVDLCNFWFMHENFSFPENKFSAKLANAYKH